MSSSYVMCVPGDWITFRNAFKLLRYDITYLNICCRRLGWVIFPPDPLLYGLGLNGRRTCILIAILELLPCAEVNKPIQPFGFRMDMEAHMQVPYSYGTRIRSSLFLNTLRPRQNGRHFADVISKCIFLNENVWIPMKISLKFVHKGPINNIPALVQKMAWRRAGDKPLSEPMLVSLPTHIYVTRPQWVNLLRSGTVFTRHLTQITVSLIQIYALHLPYFI